LEKQSSFHILQTTLPPIQGHNPLIAQNLILSPKLKYEADHSKRAPPSILNPLTLSAKNKHTSVSLKPSLLLPPAPSNEAVDDNDVNF
jgi:hypothetical protein